MSIIVIATAFPLPEYRADVIEAFEVAIPRAQVLTPYPVGDGTKGAL
jgi:hypothetical protein